LLRGIFPVLITPFDSEGRIDEASLRRVIRFELDGDANGLGVGGFASEAYKLTEAERLRCAEIVAEEVNGRVPIIIGMAAGSTEAAIQQAKAYESLKPAALMTLPPNTMAISEDALVDHYVALAEATSTPIMVQQSPQIMAYAGCQLSVENLAEIARRIDNITYFKIEGPGSAARIRALHPLVSDQVALFGGIGGLTLGDELDAGVAGLLPGCGFNEYFVEIWRSWEIGNADACRSVLQDAQPLINAVSGHGHEYSVRARKHLLHRAGIITTTAVRRPTVPVPQADLIALAQLVDSLKLRISS
jgi:2-keto-3-deoxy-L-arabinonate dehydratase